MYSIIDMIDFGSGSQRTPTDVVLDPFVGSGTTAIAAHQLGRRYIGYDVSPEYCKLAERRLEKEKNLSA